MEKEVRFDKWCKYCIHKKKTGTEEPCFDCLSYPSNEDSHRPIRFQRNTKVKIRPEDANDVK